MKLSSSKTRFETYSRLTPPNSWNSRLTIAGTFKYSKGKSVSKSGSIKTTFLDSKENVNNRSIRWRFSTNDKGKGSMPTQWAIKPSYLRKRLLTSPAKSNSCGSATKLSVINCCKAARKSNHCGSQSKLSSSSSLSALWTQRVSLPLKNNLPSIRKIMQFWWGTSTT